MVHLRFVQTFLLQGLYVLHLFPGALVGDEIISAVQRAKDLSGALPASFSAGRQKHAFYLVWGTEFRSDLHSCKAL